MLCVYFSLQSYPSMVVSWCSAAINTLMIPVPPSPWCFRRNPMDTCCSPGIICSSYIKFAMSSIVSRQVIDSIHNEILHSSLRMCNISLWTDWGEGINNKCIFIKFEMQLDFNLCNRSLCLPGTGTYHMNLKSLPGLWYPSILSRPIQSNPMHSNSFHFIMDYESILSWVTMTNVSQLHLSGRCGGAHQF